MSFFKNIFGNNELEKTTFEVDWIKLNHIDQLDMIINQSWEKPVLLFKHSTRCIISRTVLKNFEKNFNLEEKVVPYYLDLLEFRPISNEIAARFNVLHQSPQIIIVKNGVSIYDASHEGILVEEIRKVLGDLD